MTALPNAGRDASEVQEAEQYVRELLKDEMALLRLSKAEWKEAVRLASLVPKGRWDTSKLETDLKNARQSAKRQAALDSIPSSEMMHVGVYGRYDQALVRKVDKIAIQPWLAVPRLYQNQPSKLVFEGGRPNAEIRRSDENFTHYAGIPQDRSSEVTTAIMCSRADAALLKMHDLLGWQANLAPELEDYFRRTATFDWEAAE
jgi:hypothetical protein